MKILYAASEAVPFCKTGGLADVAGSLPPALAAEGAEIAVVLPLYQRVKERFGDQLKFECYDYVDLAWRHSYCGLFSMERDGVTWYFLDNEQYFRRPELYGYMDDGERFGFFSRAVVRMLPHLRFWPEVIHCNDWHTGLMGVFLKEDFWHDDFYKGIKVIYTIHNLKYQGIYPPSIMRDIIGLPQELFDNGSLECDGCVNYMKSGMVYADHITTGRPPWCPSI